MKRFWLIGLLVGVALAASGCFEMGMTTTKAGYEITWTPGGSSSSQSQSVRAQSLGLDGPIITAVSDDTMCTISGKPTASDCDYRLMSSATSDVWKINTDGSKTSASGSWAATPSDALTFAPTSGHEVSATATTARGAHTVQVNVGGTVVSEPEFTYQWVIVGHDSGYTNTLPYFDIDAQSSTADQSQAEIWVTYASNGAGTVHFAPGTFVVPTPIIQTGPNSAEQLGGWEELHYFLSVPNQSAGQAITEVGGSAISSYANDVFFVKGTNGYAKCAWRAGGAGDARFFCGFSDASGTFPY